MKTLLDLAVGDTLEQPEWLAVTQDMINQFADATGDHQWIHLDAARCEKESPFKTTIAHGFLTASLMPQFKLVEISEKAQGKLYKVEASCLLKSNGNPALIGGFLMLAVLKP